MLAFLNLNFLESNNIIYILKIQRVILFLLRIKTIKTVLQLSHYYSWKLLVRAQEA